MKKYIIINILLLFLFYGCVTTATKTVNFSYDVSDLIKQKLTPRSVPAKTGNESKEDLIKNGYLYIGIVSSRNTTKTCWGDDCIGFNCTGELPHKDFTNELCTKAASMGGDLVVLENNSKPSIENASKRGKCTVWEQIPTQISYCCQYGNVIV